MDEVALQKQADEQAERSAEIARRNQQLAAEIGSVLRHAPSGGALPTLESGSRCVRSTLESKRNKL
jgi:hypothetical protein